MDSRFFLGIPEIDSQHEEIDRLILSLQEVVLRKSEWHLVNPVLKRLNHLLVAHFAAEEALMAMVGYAELPQHRRMHAGVLKLFDDYFKQPPTPSEYDLVGQMISDRVLGHVMEHDMQMTGMIRDYLKTFRSPGAKPAAGEPDSPPGSGRQRR